MKTVLLSRDVVPVGEFKSRTAHWLDWVKKSGHPVVITQNGKPAGVLISPAEFDRIQEEERFLESVRDGIEDADAGRVMGVKELRKKLAAKRRKK